MLPPLFVCVIFVVLKFLQIKIALIYGYYIRIYIISKCHINYCKQHSLMCIYVKNYLFRVSVSGSFSREMVCNILIYNSNLDLTSEAVCYKSCYFS